MIAALIRIAPLAASAGISADEVTAALWSRATLRDRVEHLRVRAGPQYIDIVAFHDISVAVDAHDTLRRLVQEVIDSTPELHLWRIV